MEPIIIEVDSDLADLVPNYLFGVRSQCKTMREQFAVEEYEQIRINGHKLKGSGGGYGFDRISELGYQLELAGRDGSRDSIESSLNQLEEFLSRVEVRYV